MPAAPAPMSFSGERYVSGLVGNVDAGDIQSEHFHRYLFALQYCRGKDVLDVASGEGYGTACLGQVARSVVGVDADADAVAFATRTYADARVRFLRGAAQDLPLDGGSVDVVVSFETIEHFAEHAAFGREIVRVLRPGGLLVVSSPNRTFYSEQADYKNEFHVRELDRDGFVAFLREHFTHVRLLAQRPLCGSVILVDDAGEAAPTVGILRRGSGVFDQAPGAPDAPFLVALASDAPPPPVASSVLHNPVLLESLEALRTQAVEQARAQREHADQLGQQLAAMREEERQRQVALLAAQAEVVPPEPPPPPAPPPTTRPSDARLAAMRTAAHARIALVRRELEETRARNGHLLSELATAQALRDRLEEVTARNLALSRDEAAVQHALGEARMALAQVLGSTSWRLAAPFRAAARVVPRGARTRLRRLARSVARRPGPAAVAEPLPPAPVVPEPTLPATGAAPAEVVADPPLEESAAALVPAKPSDHFRALDPEWRPAETRPEFVRLREHRPAARIAAVLHVFYPELWPELATALTNITEPFDLFVTLVADASAALAPAVLEAFPAATVLVVDNHGRDILPFMQLLHAGVLCRYEYIVKLHTKRTTWRPGGDEWRQHLVAGILGDAERTEHIVRAFDTDPDVGMVIADGQSFSGREFWASNEEIVRRLGADIGLGAASPEKSFAGGSIYWVRGFLLRTLGGVGLGFDDFEPEPLRSDGATAHAVERLISLVCHDAGMRIVEVKDLAPAPLDADTAGPPAPAEPTVHVIANYLPQFHPTEENSAWWGPGFTEWTNVTRARALFPGHRQPRLPADLGFYDLRLAETRRAQADLAARYGVTAFCYYYYWFNGRRLLDRPLDSVLASGEPDFPFMICWANEPWTRRWDGLARETLMPQEYAEGWETRFAADIAPVLHDRRYLRLGGRPVVAFYRVRHIPDAAAAMGRLRAALASHGLPEVELVGAALQVGDDPPMPAWPGELGLDALFEFPPHGIEVRRASPPEALDPPDLAERIYDFNATVEATLDRMAAQPGERRYRGVMAGWDNTARRGAEAHLFLGATPTNFRRWLRATIRQARAEAEGPETAVFVNAWNEWAEGTYLEPDQHFGRGWLEAVASASGRRVAAPRGVPDDLGPPGERV